MAAVNPALASRHGDVSDSSHKRPPPVAQSKPLVPLSGISAGFPALDIEGDSDHRMHVPHGADGFDGDDPESRKYVEKLLEKVPQSVWQPNAVVQRHRRKATLYWLLLLVGYGVYIGLASASAFLATNHTVPQSENLDPRERRRSISPSL